MVKKSVIYVRVSSDIQDYERQIVDLTKFAKKEDFFIPEDGIFEDKLSGFKDETERLGLKNLMDYCLKHEIKNVLIWEISRLARKHVILLNLTEFFTENKINVYFHNQNRWLLDIDGKVNNDTSMMISVMGWYGQYEAKLMQDRFRSRKLLNESLGKYNGGKIPFGYKLDELKKYIINEDKVLGLDVSEADIVREVFDLYEKGLVCSKICMICRSKGYPKIVLNTHTLARLLRNVSYIGHKSTKLGNRPTPPIINESQFYAVNDLVTLNKTKADKGKKHIFLLRGILRCSVCNKFYVGKQTDDGYICPQNSGSNKTNNNSSCNGGLISISNLEGIVWERVKYWLTKWKVEGFDDEDLVYKSRISEMNEQIKRYNNTIQDIEKQKDRLNFMFKNGGSSPEDYLKELTKNISDREKYVREIALLQADINEQELRKEEYASMGKRIENINSITDRNQMKKLVKNIIKEVYFYKAGLFKTVLFIKYHRISTVDCILYNTVAKKGNVFKLTFTKYFMYDNSREIFYGLKDMESVSKFTNTKILKENGIGLDLPDYISLYDFAKLTEKHNRNDIEISNMIDFPIPNATNSLVYKFDDLIKMPEEINGILTTHKYNKIEYFKDLKRSRFNRKKALKGSEN